MMQVRSAQQGMPPARCCSSLIQEGMHVGSGHLRGFAGRAHREQRLIRAAPHGLHDGVEGGLRIAVGCQGGRAHGRHQAAERAQALQPHAHGQGVDAAADGLERGRVHAPSKG